MVKESLCQDRIGYYETILRFHEKFCKFIFVDHIDSPHPTNKNNTDQ